MKTIPISENQYSELLERIYELEKQNVTLADGLALAIEILRKLQAKVNADE